MSGFDNMVNLDDILTIKWYMWVVLFFIQSKRSCESFAGTAHFVEYKILKGTIYVINEWEETE